MNGLAIDFDGSEVAAIEVGEGMVVVRFAVMHATRSAGPRGQPREEGYVPSLVMTCSNASVPVHEGPCIGRVNEGMVAVGDTRRRQVPLPFEATGPISLRLVFAHGARLTVQATHMRLAAPGGLRFIDTYAC